MDVIVRLLKANGISVVPLIGFPLPARQEFREELEKSEEFHKMGSLRTSMYQPDRW